MNINFLKKNLIDRVFNVGENPQRGYHIVDDFLCIPVLFFNIVGIEPYESVKKPSLAFKVFYTLNMINMAIAFITELAFMVILFRDDENFLESCIVVGYVSFVFVGVLKLFTGSIRKQKVTILVRQLESCFPSSSEKDQEEYDVKTYLKRCNIFTKGFGGLLTIMCFAHFLIPISLYLVETYVLRSPDTKQYLPFYELAPWDWHGGWKFYLTYLHQSIAGYTATCGSISCDIMIFAVVFQVIMHYERLAKVLREYKVRNHTEPNGAYHDMQVLQSLVANHIDILRLTDVVNDVFGVPLLLNFMASSLLVCLVGFQLTVEFSPEYFFKQVLLLSSALVEIYLLCSFSQMVIDASADVSSAAYHMDWIQLDTKCRKMLLFICLRAQKPECLKATIVLDLSIATMSTFLGMSYKFFCAIQTMYQ
ncbi:odorant receptor 67a [Drosophila eugracilis]|uniref:odorant receptor 67a n=1 Tax=Drosophila eugracilis TaxID=29029 RepID=UPI0007E602F1|nr:odorant receptor 67a [Drosophila eugracilis]